MNPKILELVISAKDLASATIARVGTEVGALGEESLATGSSLETAGAGASSLLVPLLAVGAAVAAVGLGSAKMAMDFDQSMVMIRTQAGASQKEVDSLRQKVLDLAPAVGQGPEALAKGLFFIESAGFRGAAAMDILKLAAEGAAIGQTDLASTANALTSVMNTQILGAQSATQAMGNLNAIVGAGKMHFEDLNAAIGTGFLNTAQQFGISLDSIGAALADLTRNGEPAQAAATRLRMAITLMAAPTNQASKVLTGLGIDAVSAKAGTEAMTEALAKAHVTTNQLATDLRQPNGFMVAITDLKTHLENSGLSAEAASAAIARAFGGGRSSGPILAMLSDTKGLDDSFKQIKRTAGDFASDWAAQQQQANQKLHEFTAGLSALAIQLGEHVLVAIMATADAIGKLWKGFTADPGVQAAFKAIADAASQVWVVFQTQLMPALERFWKEVGPTLVPLLKDLAIAIGVDLVVGIIAFLKVTALLIEAWAIVYNALTTGIETVVKVTQQIIATCQRAWTTLKNDVDTFVDTVKKKWDGFWSDTKSAFDSGVDAVTGTWTRLWDGLNKLLEPWKKNFLKTLGDGLSDAVKAMEKYDIDSLKKWGDSFEKMGDAAAKWFGDLPKKFDAWLDKVKDSFDKWKKKVGKWTTDTLDNIVDSSTQWFKDLPKKFDDWLATTKTSFDTWKKHVGKWTTDALDDMVKAVKDFFTNLPDTIKKDVTESGTKTSGHHINAIIDVWKDPNTLTKIGYAIIGVFVALPLLVIATVAIAMVNLGIKMIQSIIDGILIATEFMVKAMVDVGSKIVKAAVGFGTLLVKTGSDLIQGLINGITGMVGSATKSVENLGGSIVGSLKSVLGIHSPSTVFAEMGANMGQGLINGITGSHAGVQKAVNGLVQLPRGTQGQATDPGSAGPTQASASQAVGGSGGSPINLTVNVGTLVGNQQAISQLATQIHQAIIQIGRSNGINVPTYGVRPL